MRHHASLNEHAEARRAANYDCRACSAACVLCFWLAQNVMKPQPCVREVAGCRLRSMPCTSTRRRHAPFL